MDDFDDEDDTDIIDGETIRKIEVGLLEAIAQEYEGTTGEPVTVASYLVVAQVVDEDGDLSMMWATTDRMPAQAMLGHAHWLLKRVDEAT